MLLDNQASLPSEDINFRYIHIKKTIKILGIYFTYNCQLKQKLNVDEIINSIKAKLKI